jgi:hypothetical protein
VLPLLTRPPLQDAVRVSAALADPARGGLRPVDVIRLLDPTRVTLMRVLGLLSPPSDL